MTEIMSPPAPKPMTDGQIAKVVKVYEAMLRKQLANVDAATAQQVLQSDDYINEQVGVLKNHLLAAGGPRFAHFSYDLDPKMRIVDQDELARAVTVADLKKAMLIQMLQDSEGQVGGEESMARLKALRHIRLGYEAAEMFMAEKELIPEAWKEQVCGRPARIYFDGTVVQKGKHRLVACIFFSPTMEDWRLSCTSLVHSRRVDDFSAILTL